MSIYREFNDSLDSYIKELSTISTRLRFECYKDEDIHKVKILKHIIKTYNFLKQHPNMLLDGTEGNNNIDTNAKITYVFNNTDKNDDEDLYGSAPNSPVDKNDLDEDLYDSDEDLYDSDNESVNSNTYNELFKQHMNSSQYQLKHIMNTKWYIATNNTNQEEDNSW